ncbi:hypothetical protein GCM10010250_50500 [Streptomyces althioticus]|nr:hypothetical protein GCM10010250_50500 [Streptomyces althioticus]
MHEHERVVVHVDDAALGCDALGQFVRVVGGGESRAHVQELPNAGLPHQEAHGPREEPPLQPDDGGEQLVPGTYSRAAVFLRQQGP